jgi:diguanylate cyclase (GGDEF)-like protein
LKSADLERGLKLNIRDHSSHFTVYVFTLDVDLGASVKVYLSQAGYDAYFFQDIEALEQRLHENPPHLLVFSTAVLAGSLSDFVEHVLKANSDIKFIAISAASQFDILAQYNDHGFVDVVTEDKAAMETRIVWAVDRACEKLYLTYQNEQIFDDLQHTKEQLTQAHQAAVTSMKKHEETKAVVEVATKGPSVSARIGDYRSAQSKEDLIQKFLNNGPEMVQVYFKFLPSVRSFVATHAKGVDGASIQGVGCQIEMQEARDLGVQMTLGKLPPTFASMLSEAFHFNPPRGLPIYSHTGLEGVLVYSADADKASLMKLQEEFSMFSMCYSFFALEKKIDALEVQDFVTELFNRSHYLKVLEGEVSRARRLQLPLSIVKVALDDFIELESSLGEPARDELLKSLAAVISKTSRTNDITCRSGLNEIAMILPHCSKKGAALRAERLRRIVEGATFLEKGMKVSISLGISEYPSLCNTPQSLDETATKALTHILDKGGNKICLFKAPSDYTPEFEIPAE